MPEDRAATITIERATGHLCALLPLRVFIDGRLAGKLRRNRRGEFLVPAGEHVVAVALASYPAGPFLVCLEPGARVDLVCGSNQPPMHPWHVHAFWFLFLFVTLDAIGSIVPPIRAFVRGNLLAEALIVLALGFIGMMLHFRQVRASNAWRPALWLEMISTAGA